MRIIIAGGGTAAIECAIAIRQYDQKSSIDLYSAESILPYRRPLLVKVLSGEMAAEHLPIYPAEFYDKNNINIHLSQKINKVDKSTQCVISAGGKTIPYDRLLLAVGSRSRQLTVAPALKNHVLSLHDLIDVDLIEAKLKHSADITVVGGGILGLECADALLKRNFQVNLIELHDTLMHGMLDYDSSRFLQRKLLECNKNLFLYTSCTLRQLVRQGNKAVCYLSNPANKVIYTDLIISAIGMEPWQNWGFEIAADDFLQIKDRKNIFGAGDCVSVCGRKSSFYKEARMQGKIAGANIAGLHMKYNFQLPECRSIFSNMPFYCAGLTNPAITESTSEYDSNSYKKLFYQQKHLVGCILIGNTSEAGELYSTIKKHHQSLR